jgi:hypothetical protein
VTFPLGFKLHNKRGGLKMKVILDIAIVVKGKQLYTMLRKQYDTELYPIPGIEIEDSAWKDPKVPTSIICNFDEGYYLLNFQSLELDAEESCKREEEMYRLHGWKRPSEGV